MALWSMVRRLWFLVDVGVIGLASTASTRKCTKYTMRLFPCSNYSSGLEDGSLEQTVTSVTLHSSCLSDTSSSSGVSNMCVMPPTHILFRPVAAAGRHAHAKVTETDMSHSGQTGTDDAMCSEAATYEQFTMSVHRTESLSSSTSTTSTSEQHSAFNKVGVHRL